jgi:phage terminase small subunit
MREFSRYPGLVQRPDREAMIALCSEWAEYVRAIKDRDTAKGRALDSARRQARDTLKNLQVMWARFGLTPGDRARFDLKDREGDDAPILALLTASSDESN